MMELSRRTLLAGSAMAATASVLPPLARPVLGAAAAAGQQAPGVYRQKIGDYEVTAINDGIWDFPITDKFVRNAPLPDVHKVLSDMFLPTDKLPIPITSLVVNTGAKLVVVDTGTGAQLMQLAPRSGKWSANLAAAGIDPKAVDTVVISHFHPDHINGIKDKDGKLNFPNAEIMVAAPEWAFWMDDANMSAAPEGLQFYFRNCRRIFADIAKDVTRFEPGKEIAPGITSIAAPGHTPGHTVLVIASANQSMLHLVDTSNNPWLFVRHPEWQVAFDQDGDLAVENRKKLLDRAAADKMRVHGYHFPFPGSGYITKAGSGFDFVPAMWQPNV